jgi:hypothetical protein
VPSGTNVSSLIASFTASTGATVKVGSTTQVSGQTANNFTNSVTYVVTAEDGTTTQSYTVQVTVSQSTKSTACDITMFKFTTPNITGVINGTNISLTVPTGTNVTSLIANFTASTGATVKVGSITQVSGQTTNNFTNTVTYVVTAEDGITTKSYTVQVTVSSGNLSSAKDILTFGFTNPVITATISGTNITAEVPFGTDVSTLVATFTVSPNATVSVNNIQQESAKNVNDFTTVLTYTVTAQDGSSKSYTVSVTVKAKLSSDKDILAYSLKTPAVNGTISGTSISITVPDGTSLSNLIALFTLSPGATLKVGAVTQASGVTTNNYTAPLVLTVQAEDGTTKNYTVVVTTQSTSGSSAKDLISFGIYQPIIPGVINGNTVTITSSTKTIDITSLMVTFEVSTGAKLVLSGTTLTSRVSKLNFTNSITVTVIAADGSNKDYVINLILPKSNQKNVIFFKSMNPYSEGKIDTLKKEIHISVPYGTNVAQIQPVFMVSDGAKVYISTVLQTSGANTIDFTKSVVYTIVAEDGSKVTYTVFVDVLPKSTLDIQETFEKSLRVYPNPSNGILKISAETSELMITVLDIHGKIIYSKELNNYTGSEEIVDISDFSEGVYFMNLSNNQLSKTIKLDIVH